MIRVYILPWHIKSYKFIPIDSHRKRCNYGALIVSGQVEFVFFAGWELRYLVPTGRGSCSGNVMAGVSAAHKQEEVTAEASQKDEGLEKFLEVLTSGSKMPL